jgi:hypothetical protein
MEPFGPDITPLFSQNSVLLILKLMFGAAFFLYFLFSVVVWSQIRTMVGTLNGQLDLPLKAFGLLFMIFSLLTLLGALVVL